MRRWTSPLPRLAARRRVQAREFAPPLLVGVADAEEDEEDATEAPAPRLLKVVPDSAPLSE